MTPLPGWAWTVGGGVLGLLIGSFLATLVLRWPRGESVVGGRSHCDGCGRTLAGYELVPLASALLARGRCRCGAPIDPTHWQIEAAAGMIAGLAFLWAPGWPGLAWAIFGWTLLALAALDLRHFWLPDRLTLPLLVIGLGIGGIASGATWPERAIGAAIGFGALWLIAAGYRRLRGREGLGLGDAKLLGAIGAWLGWAALPFVLVIAGLVGLIATAVALLRRRNIAATTMVPLGTLLCAAAVPGWWLARSLVG